MLNLPLKKNNESNREYIYRTLKENIVNFDLKPEDMISEPEISKLFEVSRTPVREAFIKLSEENLLEVFPQKGTLVPKINLNKVQEAIFMRENLEKSVFLVAKEKLTEENILDLKKIVNLQENLLESHSDMKKFYDLDNKFHFTIFSICGFENIWKAIQNISQDYNRFRTLDSLSKLSATKIIAQHREIIKSIETKNSKAFNTVMSKHLRNLTSQISDLKDKYPNYFL